MKTRASDRGSSGAVPAIDDNGNEGRAWANLLLAGPWFAAEAMLAGGAAAAAGR